MNIEHVMFLAPLDFAHLLSVLHIESAHEAVSRHFMVFSYTMSGGEQKRYNNAFKEAKMVNGSYYLHMLVRV